MEKYFYRYLPTGLICIALIFQYNIFVTPEKLEIKHRAIMSEIAEKYATKEQSADLKSQLDNMQNKLDKIYDLLINNGGKK